MTTISSRGLNVPSEEEIPILEEVVRILGTDPDERASLVGSNGTSVEVPDTLMNALRLMADYLARDMGVSIVPVHRGLTTQQAADILDISRPFLIQLLEQGEVPFHMVGTHRRIEINDLLSYKRRRDEERREALDGLTRLSQEMGLYDKPIDQP